METVAARFSVDRSDPKVQAMHDYAHAHTAHEQGLIGLSSEGLQSAFFTVVYHISAQA